MNLNDLSEKNVYFHGSSVRLPIGTILLPNPNYEEVWSRTSFYEALETYRPTNMLSHASSVFMCDNPDDIELVGASTEWLFSVIPIGSIQRHDVNWSSEISSLIDLGYPVDSLEVKDAAQAYWSGEESPNEVLWEYLCSSAKIISVEKY